MRELSVHATPVILSSAMYSVLQLCAINEPSFPNLKTLNLWLVAGELIRFIPFLLSSRTTAISIIFVEDDLPTTAFASVITALPTRCPDLEVLALHHLPKDPIIVAAVSEMLLATNRNILKSVWVESLLTAGAREVIYKIPSLCGLMVVIEKDTLLPPMILPNLTKIMVNSCGSFRERHLESVTLNPESEQLGDFLEAFEGVALVTSTQNTLSEFRVFTLCPWSPDYSSLLPFAHLTVLVVESSCDDGCFSNVDDDVITNLARTMPKLKTLQLGDIPCQSSGVTVKGLVVLSNHCLDLSTLRVHFQVASLTAPPAISGMASGSAPTNLQRRGCALRELDVGEIGVSDESVLMVALTLVRIFPRIDHIEYPYGNWGKVMEAVRLSRETIDHSCKEHPLLRPEVTLMTPPPRSCTQEP